MRRIFWFVVVPLAACLALAVCAILAAGGFLALRGGPPAPAASEPDHPLSRIRPTVLTVTLSPGPGTLATPEATAPESPTGLPEATAALETPPRATAA
ncbi:MAG: hypothetical protein RBU35_23035, partial [Anaerolineae bacterium]|nr:hypothetical protein [Anaerolineae bacterium]